MFEDNSYDVAGGATANAVKIEELDEEAIMNLAVRFYY